MSEQHVILKGLTDDTANLGRFGHHPNPAIDFCIEVEALQGRLFDADHGISKPGSEPEAVKAVLKDIERAMDFIVGGDQGAVAAKQFLRGLECEAKSFIQSSADAS